MFNNIRLRMLTLLVVKLSKTQENHFLSSNEKRRVLERTKLMPDAACIVETRRCDDFLVFLFLSHLQYIDQ